MKVSHMAALGGGALLAVAALWLVAKKNGGARGVGAAAGAAVVDAADGAVQGVVTGIGSLVGIPETNESACEAAMREGRTWDASFACPAATFARYLATPKRTSDGKAQVATAFWDPNVPAYDALGNRTN